MRDDHDRESIWSVPTRWKSLYFALFTVMIAVSSGFILFYEMDVVTDDDQWKTALAVAKDLSSAFPALAGINLVIVEVYSVLSRKFDEWLSARQRAEARDAERAEWVAWVNRMREAQAKGETFDEPSPAEKELVDA